MTKETAIIMAAACTFAYGYGAIIWVMARLSLQAVYKEQSIRHKQIEQRKRENRRAIEHRVRKSLKR